MKAHQLIVILLIMTLVLVNLVLSRIVHNAGLVWPDALCVVGLGLIFAQIVLVASWLVWSSRNFALRIILSLAILYFLAHPASTYAIDDPSSWFTANLSFLAIISTVFLVARFAGVSIDQVDDHNAPTGLGSWQFSISGILSVTTGTACLFGAARNLHVPATAGVSTLLFFLAISAVATIAFFSSFCLHRVGLAVLVIGLAATMIGYVLSLTGIRVEGPWTVVQMNLAHAGAIAGSIAVARIAQYRLTVATGHTP